MRSQKYGIDMRNKLRTCKEIFVLSLGFGRPLIGTIWITTENPLDDLKIYAI